MRSSASPVSNNFKFLCVFTTLSLEVTNTPRMAKVLGSNLTRNCFFFIYNFSD